MSNNSEILEALANVIESRKDGDAEKSYVAKLFTKGRKKIAQKVGEEAVETVIEAMKVDQEKLSEESADLLFHLMVLWADQNITPDDVLGVLQQRLGHTGIRK